MTTILLVEDNERNRKLARTILAFRGYEVVERDAGAPATVPPPLLLRANEVFE